MSQQYPHGVFINRHQIGLQLLQVFLVGLTIGMTRTVIPGLADTEFGLGDQQFLLLTSFVVAFGAVKAAMNLGAGRWSDHYGRRRVLLAGWLVALPIPLMIWYAPNWNWIVAATVLLGVNQGLCWSMTINSKLDLARLDQKGLINGLNEFSGYAAVAIAGIVTAYFVAWFGARVGLLIFGSVVILSGLFVALTAVRETMPWAQAHHHQTQPEPSQSLKQLFWRASWQDPTLLALNQAGLIEKFTDALVWIFLPVYFLSRDLSLVEGSAIISIYGLVWGGSQLITGPLSDKIGRRILIVGGMWLCGLGLISMPLTSSVLWWSLEAALIGLGMAMLYPTLGAAVADFSPPRQRSTILGIYRFWRDFGYAAAALAMGLIAQWTASLTAPFWLAAGAMLLSGLWVLLRVPGRLAQESP
ncbi:MAG: MFS transporter [Thiotrichales bacterium]